MIGSLVPHTSDQDAYISVVESLKHAGYPNRCTVNIKWVDSEEVTDENAAEIFSDVSGILVPGGFGSRGIDGKIASIKYARENNIPFLGLCLGMQLSIVEFARDVIGFRDAHSIELNPSTTHPVISLMPDQEGITDIGGTLRLGSFSAGELLKQVRDTKSFIIFENIKNIKVTDISMGVARTFKKELDVNDAYVIQGDKIERVRVVQKG